MPALRVNFREDAIQGTPDDMRQWYEVLTEGPAGRDARRRGLERPAQ